MNEPKVSIVIVCMNNLKNLVPCLDSIAQQTTVLHEIWVVAYLFSKENISFLRNKYPNIKICENNDIAGFSENNNIALRQITSPYALILNDDTLFKEPVLDQLIAAMQAIPDASIMSPKLLNADGSLQSCGKAPSTNWDFILAIASLRNSNYKKNKYINQTGVFQSYNITGACFLIKMEVMRALGYFNEYYFFCPEDLALSTLANKRGYKCYVDSETSLYHLQGKTSSMIKVATLPAARKGGVYFHSEGSKTIYFLLALYIFSICILKTILFYIKGDFMNSKAQWHCVASIFSKKTPKEIFTRYYLRTKK